MEPDAAEAGSAGSQKRKTHPLAPRIKRLIQSDEDVGKIAQATPHLIGVLLFILPPPPRTPVERPSTPSGTPPTRMYSHLLGSSRRCAWQCCKQARAVQACLDRLLHCLGCSYALVKQQCCLPQHWPRRSSSRTWPAARCRSRSPATPRPCSLPTCARSGFSLAINFALLCLLHDASKQCHRHRHTLDMLSRMLNLPSSLCQGQSRTCCGSRPQCLPEQTPDADLSFDADPTPDPSLAPSCPHPRPDSAALHPYPSLSTQFIAILA